MSSRLVVIISGKVFLLIVGILFIFWRSWRSRSRPMVLSSGKLRGKSMAACDPLHFDASEVLLQHKSPASVQPSHQTYKGQYRPLTTLYAFFMYGGSLVYTVLSHSEQSTGPVQQPSETVENLFLKKYWMRQSVEHMTSRTHTKEPNHWIEWALLTIDQRGILRICKGIYLKFFRKFERNFFRTRTLIKIGDSSFKCEQFYEKRIIFEEMEHILKF
jgi:hypothetical protein